MKKLLLPTLFLTLTLALVACGGDVAPATEAAPQVTINMETNPNPAVVGDVELSFTITDQSERQMECR